MRDGRPWSREEVDPAHASHRSQLILRASSASSIVATTPARRIASAPSRTPVRQENSGEDGIKVPFAHLRAIFTIIRCEMASKPHYFALHQRLMPRSPRRPVVRATARAGASSRWLRPSTRTKKGDEIS
jgi:hypothetical protein